MAAKDDLWAAVKLRYDEPGLISLTNVRKRSTPAINDTVGTQAADDVILCYYTDIQTDYDPDSKVHVMVAVEGVVAMLWRRGGSAATIQRVKWEDWIERAKILKNVEPRGHAQPQTNSGLQPTTDCYGHRPCRPWADKINFRGLMPRRSSPLGPYGGPTEWD